jgi:ankyrin repeat protein
VNERTGDEQITPLITAVEWQDEDMIRYLSQCNTVKVDPNIADIDGDHPLVWCCYLNTPSMIKTLYRHFPNTINPHFRNSRGSSPLMVGYRQYCDRNEGCFIELLSSPMVNKRGYEFIIMLSHAIFTQRTKAVELLLKSGADPHAIDDSGRSLLFLAALYGSVEIFTKVRELAERSDKERTKKQLGLVPYACASRNSTVSKEIVAQLNKDGIKESPADGNGWTLENYAAYMNSEKAVNNRRPPSSDGEDGRKYRMPSWAISDAKGQGEGPDDGHLFFEVNQTKLKLKNPFPEGVAVEHSSSRVMIRTNSCIPFHQKQYYWELTIDEHPQGDECIVAIGICAHNFYAYSMPGWPRSGAYGYHSDDGGFFTHTDQSNGSARPYGPGDTVGCLVTIDDDDSWHSHRPRSINRGDKPRPLRRRLSRSLSPHRNRHYHSPPRSGSVEPEGEREKFSILPRRGLLNRTLQFYLVSDQDGTQVREPMGDEIKLADSMRGPLFPCVGFSAGAGDVGMALTANFGIRFEMDGRNLRPLVDQEKKTMMNREVERSAPYLTDELPDTSRPDPLDSGPSAPRLSKEGTS